MEKPIQSVLYIDPQQQKPKALCPVCGRECYGPGGCIRCARGSEA